MAMQAGKRHTVNRAVLEKLPLFKNDPIRSIEPVGTQGYCNLNYRIETTRHTYLLRVFKEEGIDRQKEFDLQQKAANLSIAPRPLLLDLDAGWMITEFVKGEHLKVLEESRMKLLAKTLQTLHTIETDTPPLVLYDLLKERSETIERTFKLVESYPKEIVLCHNDLNPKNLLWRENHVTLIDFEYAAANDRYFDVAAVCEEFSFSQMAQANFCSFYFEGDYIVQKVEAYRMIYRQLCHEWFEGRYPLF